MAALPQGRCALPGRAAAVLAPLAAGALAAYGAVAFAYGVAPLSDEAKQSATVGRKAYRGLSGKKPEPAARTRPQPRVGPRPTWATGPGEASRRSPPSRSTAALRATADAAAAGPSAPEGEGAHHRSTGSGRALGAAGIGAVAGGLGGALGLGGGFLVVPALTSLLGTEPRLSIGTSACVVLAVSCIACRAYLARGLASVRAAAAIAVAALVTARVGATLTGKVNPKLLKRMFGGWLIIVSTVIGVRAAGLMPLRAVPGASEAAALAPLFGLGAGTGLVSGLLGVGGGTVLVPSLTLAFHFPQSEAQGCALLGMVPPSAVSALTHWRRGNVDRSLVGGAVLGALVGGWSGSLVAASLPERALRAVFAAVLGAVGVKYLRS
uniref:Membrane transporter protein n=1 Tax=Pyrodinium bahamense TaxID=73915 RepID=A0A7R9ZZ69_9DINO